MKAVVWAIAIVLISLGAWYWWNQSQSRSASTSSISTTTPVETYGMAEYTDPTYGFSFWYPASLNVTASTTNDKKSFPGGLEVERLQVGEVGGTYVAVVISPKSTITDEPNGHASPIAQTKYFYDVSNGQWMIAFPEGAPVGNSATTTADTSRKTVGGLTLLQAGARFDTKIIPLSTTTFLVIGDGGGSFFTSQLQQTVAASDATVDPAALSAALQAEANAYASGK